MKETRSRTVTVSWEMNLQCCCLFLPYRNFNLADVITLCNGACGALSIFSNLRYLISHDQYYLKLAMWCIPLGFTFDVFDGRVARWRKTTSILGQELDSLADAVSFFLCCDCRE